MKLFTCDFVMVEMHLPNHLKYRSPRLVNYRKCGASSVDVYYTGCAKEKKDILNIYVKSQIINIFFLNWLLTHNYICWYRQNIKFVS